MSISYNPEHAHQIFNMTESDNEGQSILKKSGGNSSKYQIKNVRKMEKDDINNIVGLRKSTRLGNIQKSRTNQNSMKAKSSMGA